jgi:hypothetical protein
MNLIKEAISISTRNFRIYTYIYYVGFEILTAVVMKSIIFWDITSCSTFNVNRRFGETYCLHLQASNLLSRWYFLYLFDPEDEGVLFLLFFLSFMGWGEAESTWYVGHYLVYCTSPG